MSLLSCNFSLNQKWNLYHFDLLHVFSHFLCSYVYLLELLLAHCITYASTDCTGGVGETIKRKGGVSQACLGKSTSFI